MQFNKTLSPSELLLLNAGRFFERGISPQSFPALQVDNPSEAILVDERSLGIRLLSVSVAANLEAGCVSVVELPERSILIDDKYALTLAESPCIWPEKSLEEKVYKSVSRSASSSVHLSNVVRQILNPSGVTTPWRDLCWSVYRELFDRGLLTADETEIVHPFDSNRSLKYRGGPYKPTPELKALVNGKTGLEEVAALVERYCKEHTDWIVALTGAAEITPAIKASKV